MWPQISDHRRNEPVPPVRLGNPQKPSGWVLARCSICGHDSAINVGVVLAMTLFHILYDILLGNITGADGVA